MCDIFFSFRDMNLILFIVDEAGTWWSYLIAFIFLIIFMPLAIQSEIIKNREQDKAHRCWETIQKTKKP